MKPVHWFFLAAFLYQDLEGPACTRTWLRRQSCHLGSWVKTCSCTTPRSWVLQRLLGRFLHEEELTRCTKEKEWRVNSLTGGLFLVNPWDFGPCPRQPVLLQTFASLETLWLEAIEGVAVKRCDSKIILSPRFSYMKKPRTLLTPESPKDLRDWPETCFLTITSCTSWS